MSKPGNILVLTADEDQQRSFRCWLEESGFAVTVAADSKEALRQATGGAFSLIVVDLASTADGVDLIKEVRDRQELINVMMLAIAPWGSGLGTLALYQDVDAFEPAPIDAARLKSSVERLLENRVTVTQ